MLDRITGMQVFAKVAGLGSFSAAARALGMSQTMATKHVAALEERLGARLLHRTTRRVTPTGAGRLYLEQVERILAEIAEADAIAAAERVQPTGTLRLNAPISFGVRQVAPALADFMREYPSINVDFGLNDRTVDLVEEGWDVAIRIGRLADSALVARKLAPCRILVCAAPAYLEARGVPRTVADLARHDCLGYTLSSLVGPDRWGFGPDGATAVPVAGTLRAGNGDALLVAALAGQGVIYQPTFIVGEHVREGRLVALPLDLPTAETAVYAIQPPGRRPAAKVRAFVDFLAARYGPEPPWDR